MREHQQVRPHGRTAATAVLVLVVLAGAVTASTALFSASTRVTDNSVAAGTVDLTAAPARSVFRVGALAPGDVRHAPLVLTNTGTLDLRHAMSVTTDGPVGGGGLGQRIQLAVRSGVASCDAAGWSSGTLLSTGPLGSATGTRVYGDPRPGADPGDRVLAAGATERLCLRVRLDVGVDETLGGASTTATLLFAAEQTANNP